MKKAGFIILGLLAAYVVLAIVAPGDGKVERSITINKAASEVRPYLVDYKMFHETWSPWAEKDSATKVQYSGASGEPGHKMEWWSEVESVGTGSLEIVRFSGDTILGKLSFEGMGSSDYYYLLMEKDGKAEVTMGMMMNVPFIFKPMMFFMDAEKQIAPDFEHGLDNLKKIAESAKEEPKAYAVKEIEWPSTSFVGSKREVLGLADMPAYFGKNLPGIYQALGKVKVQPLSAPTAIYWSFDEKEMKGDLAAAFRVPAGTKLRGFTNYDFPAGKVLMVEYFGGYNQIMGAYAALEEQMNRMNRTQLAAFEEYVTDPATEKDSTRWQTNVYYLLK